MPTQNDTDFRALAKDLVDDFGGGGLVTATITNKARNGYVPGSGTNAGTDQVYTVACAPPQATTIRESGGQLIEVWKIVIAAIDLEAAVPSQGDPTPMPPNPKSTVALGDVLTKATKVQAVKPMVSGEQVAAYEVFVVR